MKSLLTLSLSAICLAGCASTGPESVSLEKKGHVSIIHHRRHTSDGAVDRIETVNSVTGAVSQAEIHVYSVGRYVDSSGNVHEAHQMYRQVQSSRPNLMLPRRVSGGPRSGPMAPPNYSPMPNDQRINDAVSEAKSAKEKLDSARSKIDAQLANDNNLRGEIQQQSDQIQDLQSQLNSAMSTQRNQMPAPERDAQKAASGAVGDLQKWGTQIGQQ